jgi:MSHA biogenesis protein MshJ
MAAIKAQWQEWSARFAALQPREKHMVIGAVVVAIVFGGFTLWVEPAQLQKARLGKTLVQQQNEQAQLRAQVDALAAQAGDPDAGNRVLLAQVQKQLAGVESEIRDFDQALVNPAQAPVLLQTLLGRHRGLSLVSLNTLPRQALITPPQTDGKDDRPRSAAAAAAPAMPGGNIYKHGIEIKVAGGYHDLLAYVTELEQSPQRLMRGAMSLTANYPTSVLTLTVYTLSLEAVWLIV